LSRPLYGREDDLLMKTNKNMESPFDVNAVEMWKNHSQAAILNAVPSMCFIISPDQEVLQINNKVLDTLGFEKEVIFGQQFSQLLHESQRYTFQTNLQKGRTGGGSITWESKFSSNLGKIVDVELSLSPLTVNGTDQASTYCVFARDIFREKEMELDYLRFSNIAHGTVNPLEITDIHGRIIYANPAFERVSGYSKEELVGKNPNVFGSGKHPKSFWQKMWATISAGKVWVGEIENRKHDGEPFFTQLLVSPIIDNEGTIKGYFGVHRDISEQKRLERQLIHAQKMESIGMLAAGIAHEVGNPLTSISSLVQVIQRTTQDQFVNEKLDLVKSQISRISRIIRDLVDFSRPSNLEVQLTNVNRIVREAVEIVRVGKKAKEISFEVNLDENIPPLPLVPDKLEQVFINILINAVDAMHTEEGVVLRDAQAQKKRIAVSTSIDQDRVKIILEDNGSGISEDDMPKVFEPFFTTKKVGQGTGLGLWVTYTIVRSFQGNITVNSHKGRGTAVTITFPLHSDLS
jgi:PAS domain S-box-containing protein